MQRQITFGGGVSPRNTRLRGQSIIEYVLIIADIGLAIVFAGPGVAGGIRNQFNLVGETIDNGTSGNFAGPDSATVKAAIAKDAKDWTLDEQKAVAEDIAAKGEASHVWAKAHAAMDNRTEFSMKLTDGETLTYRIIGMNHDNLADGSGKAGLTFLTTSTGIKSRMNTTDTNAGGWEKSELRQKMNSGEIWKLMPTDFQSKVKSVTKLTNNFGAKKKGTTVTATSDKLFLLSLSEIAANPSFMGSDYPWIVNEGTQYEAFKGRVVISKFSTSESYLLSNGDAWWERTTGLSNPSLFFNVGIMGGPAAYNLASNLLCVCPAWCF